jgi:hypothetical protein
MHKAVLRDKIWTEGRGPELYRVHYAGRGEILVALEYLNPDWRSEEEVRHLVIGRAHVFMFTPEEVHDYAQDDVRWGPQVDHAAVANLGKSTWLRTFSQQHLARCDHFRILFYDQILDVICEEIAGRQGAYIAPEANSQP